MNLLPPHCKFVCGLLCPCRVMIFLHSFLQMFCTVCDQPVPFDFIRTEWWCLYHCIACVWKFGITFTVCIVVTQPTDTGRGHVEIALPFRLRSRSHMFSLKSHKPEGFFISSGGSKGGGASLGAQFLSIPCSFWKNLAKSYVGAPRGVGAPSSGKSWIRHWFLTSSKSSGRVGGGTNHEIYAAVFGDIFSWLIFPAHMPPSVPFHLDPILPTFTEIADPSWRTFALVLIQTVGNTRPSVCAGHIFAGRYVWNTERKQNLEEPENFFMLCFNIFWNLICPELI